MGHSMRLLILASLLLTGGLAGTVLASRKAVVRIPVIRQDAAPRSTSRELLCRGGERPKLEVELVPDAVLKKEGAERIEYHAEFSNHMAKGGTAEWTATLIDDTGHEVTKLSSGHADIAANSQAVASALSPDPGDGYYALRVRVAFVTDGDEAVADGFQPLEVSHGVMREISIDDWFTKTAAVRAVPVELTHQGGAQ